MGESKKIRLYLKTPAMERGFTGERYGIRFEDGYAEVSEDNPFLGFLFDMGVVRVDVDVAADEAAAPEAAVVAKPRNKGELMDVAKSLGLEVPKDAKVAVVRELVENAEAAIAAAAAEEAAAAEAESTPVVVEDDGSEETID